MITLPFSALPGTPQLFLDYANNASDAPNYFMGHFSDLMAYETHLQQLERRSYLREQLYDILVAQNKTFHSGPDTFSNLEHLRSANTFAVVTGQQVGLFTGPLYTLYKALTAVHLSRWLSDQFPAYRFIPMFWMESEDHDFLEINHAGALNKENDFVSVSYAQPEEEDPRNLVPVGQLRIDARIEESLTQLFEHLPVTDFSEEIKRLLQRTYRQGDTPQHAFACLMNDLYPDSGLIFVDPSDPEIKQLVAPVFLQELETFPTTGEEVIKRSAELEERYHAQIKPRAVNLFCIHKGNRYSIEPSEYGFFLKGTRQRFTRDEMLELANDAPERFSPNVLLRPIIQDFLLPTAAYVAGPSEVSYFAQLQPAYDHFQVPMPIIFPRSSLTIVERKVDKVFSKLSLPYGAMFLTDDDAYRLIDSGNGSTATFDIENFRQRMDVMLEELQREIATESENLLGPADTTAGNIRRALASFEDKIYQHRQRHDDVINRQISKMHVYLSPKGKPQERQLNITTFLNKYGRDILPQLEDACLPFPAEHRLLLL